MLLVLFIFIGGHGIAAVVVLSAVIGGRLVHGIAAGVGAARAGHSSAPRLRSFGAHLLADVPVVRWSRLNLFDFRNL